MRVCGTGTVPGSDKTAFRCDMPSRKTSELKETTCTGPHMLKYKINNVNGHSFTNQNEIILPVLHGLQYNPSRDNIVSVENSQIRDKHADESARIPDESHNIDFNRIPKRP